MSTAPVSEPLLTAEEFFDLQEPANAGKVELRDGKVVVSMPVSGKHGKRQGIIWRALDAFAERQKEGEVTVETGFILQRNPDIVRAPDIAVARLDTLPNGELPEDSFVDGPPLLAVEVVSQSDKQRDVLDKVGDYIDHGVERVWLVRANTRNVVVYRGNGDVRLVPLSDTLTSEDAGFATAGFELPLSEIFR
jgi:Uma2 family endonuclease